MNGARAVPAGGAIVVAVLGAQGSGRTELAQALAAHFGPRPDLVVRESTAEQMTAGGGHCCDAVLLTGLDQPGPPQRAASDALLRDGLRRAGLAFDVVYGSGAQRLASALAALARRGIGEAPGAAERRGWQWSCEKCSNPECEHRLFRRLLD